MVSAWGAQAVKDLAVTDHKKAEEVADATYEDAERAYTALRLLIPSTTKQAHRYLDLCNQAAGGETANNEREDPRQAVEDTIPRALTQPLLGNNRGTGKPAHRL